MHFIKTSSLWKNLWSPLDLKYSSLYSEVWKGLQIHKSLCILHCGWESGRFKFAQHNPKFYYFYHIFVNKDNTFYVEFTHALIIYNHSRIHTSDFSCSFTMKPRIEIACSTVSNSNIIRAKLINLKINAGRK